MFIQIEDLIFRGAYQRAWRHAHGSLLKREMRIDVTEDRRVRGRVHAAVEPTERLLGQAQAYLTWLDDDFAFAGNVGLAVNVDSHGALLTVHLAVVHAEALVVGKRFPAVRFMWVRNVLPWLSMEDVVSAFVGAA